MTEVDRYRDRGGLAITVDDLEALLLYDDAVDEFAAGRPCCSLVHQCVEKAPTFALGWACEAVVAGMAPARTGWPPPTNGLTRRERQHLEIVRAVLDGRLDRASGLAADHLSEYPSDRLIAALRFTPKAR
jgi:hypothetical protein